MQSTNCMETFEGLSRSPSTSTSWKTWLAIGGSKLARGALALIETLAQYCERSRQRHALLSLDERMRKDIGLSTADIWLEASKPAWRK